jgi:hypothetical protein
MDGPFLIFSRSNGVDCVNNGNKWAWKFCKTCFGGKLK